MGVKWLSLCCYTTKKRQMLASLQLPSRAGGQMEVDNYWIRQEPGNSVGIQAIPVVDMLCHVTCADFHPNRE